MLFSQTKMKALSTQTIPSKRTQPKKKLLYALYATHAYVSFDEEFIISKYKSINTFTPILEVQIKTEPCKTNKENE